MKKNLKLYAINWIVFSIMILFFTEIACSVPGMGAVPYSGGVTFRVWGGGAKSVNVAGTFNNFSQTETPLMHEGNGFWAVDVPNAKIGDRYKFILKSASGEQLFRNDPHARSLVWENNGRNSVVVDRSFQWSPFSMPGPNKLVVYEMSVKTFDGYKGVAGKLDYLRDRLGVNAIEIMPVHQTTTPGGGWGYNPAGMFAPHADYGSYEDFKRMVDECHKSGVGVIVDVVFNHVEGDVLWKYDGWTSGTAECPLSHPDGKPWTGEHGGIYYYDWQAVLGRAWNWWHTAWGHNRPDYGRGEVRTYLKDNALYWITEMNCDGLRFDSTSNIHHVDNGGGDYIPDGASLLKSINEEVRKVRPDAVTIAEDLKDNSTVTDSWLGFTSQWHAWFVHRMRENLKSPSPDLDVVADAVRWIDNNDQSKLVKYVDSHDEAANGKSRLHQEIAGFSPSGANDPTYWSKKKNLIGHALVAFSPGIPMFLQGDECMTKGWFMDGGDMAANFNRTYADSTYAGIVKAFGDINRLRRNLYTDSSGLEGSGINVFHVNNNDKVMAFHRWNKGGRGDDVIVIVNFGDKNFSSYKLGAPRSGKWRCRFNSDSAYYDGSFGNFGGNNAMAQSGNKDGLAFSMNVAVPKFSALVYSQ